MGTRLVTTYLGQKERMCLEQELHALHSISIPNMHSSPDSHQSKVPTSAMEQYKLLIRPCRSGLNTQQQNNKHFSLTSEINVLIDTYCASSFQEPLHTFYVTFKLGFYRIRTHGLPRGTIPLKLNLLENNLNGSNMPGSLLGPSSYFLCMLL